MKYDRMKYIICDYCGQEFRNPETLPYHPAWKDAPWKAHEIGLLEPQFTEGDRYSHTASICPLCIPVPEWDKA